MAYTYARPGGYADMHHVYQGIWIGGHTALNPSVLGQAGIYDVVNTSQELMTGHWVDWQELHRAGINVQHVPLDDSMSQRIVPLSPAHQASLQFIHSCVTTGRSVLVNCAAGISRSSSTVIAYLMMYQGMFLEEALNVVRTGRPQANPNPNFMRQLRQLGGGRRGYAIPQSFYTGHPISPAASYNRPIEVEPYQGEPRRRGFFGRFRQY